jgi:dTMP kinase
VSRRGRFVVIEGADATGKSTQVALLANRLEEQGRDVVRTFEPGNTAAGRRIRELLLNGIATIAPATEALLMAADRAQHVAEIVQPALDRGAVVVSDRFVPSSVVYQGIVRDVGIDDIWRINRSATRGLEPDVVVLLDLPDEIAEARRAPTDRFEREGPAFHQRVRRAYRELSEKEGWAVVDASGTPDEVAGRVWEAVERVL